MPPNRQGLGPFLLYSQGGLPNVTLPPHQLFGSYMSFYEATRVWEFILYSRDSAASKPFAELTQMVSCTRSSRALSLSAAS